MDVEWVKERLSAMGVAQNKQEELLKNKKIKERLDVILKNARTSNKFLLVQSQYTTDVNITKAIDNGLLLNEKALKCVMELGLAYDSLEDYIKEQVVTEEIIKEEARKQTGSFKEIMKAFSEKFKFNDTRKVAELVQEVLKNRKGGKNAQNHAERPKAKDWLEEGELAKLHLPGSSPQLSEEIREAHLKRTGGVVVTRFPPEPNGFLHIGHAKAINLNFKYAEKYGGYVFLRFDDTNPKNEKLRYYKTIIEDIKWLGFTPKFVTASSDYFEKMIEFGKMLIRKNKAYVCHLPIEDIRNYRREVGSIKTGPKPFLAAEHLEKFTGRVKKHPGCCCPSPCPTHCGFGLQKPVSTDIPDKEATETFFKLSPFRNRSADTNMEIFQEMIDGKWEEETATLRLKMEEDTKNPFMLDLVAFRVIKKPHSLTGNRYKVYPSYDFALCVCDSLEDVTHSFCSREFFTRQESYKWLLENLGLYRPVQWEFSRLNIDAALLSKRKIKKLMKDGVITKFDDPRLFTIQGLRRRGFTPNAINKFCESVGVTFSESSIDVRMLESFVRDDLNNTSKRIMCVRNPICTFLVCDQCLQDFREVLKHRRLMEYILETSIEYLGNLILSLQDAYASTCVQGEDLIHNTEAVIQEHIKIERSFAIISRMKGKLETYFEEFKELAGDVQDGLILFFKVRAILKKVKKQKKSIFNLVKCGRVFDKSKEESLCKDFAKLLHHSVKEKSGWIRYFFSGCSCDNSIVPEASKVFAKKGDRPIVFDRLFYIDGDDFVRDGEENFMRLTLNRGVGLIGLFPVEVVEEIDGLLVVKRSDKTPKKYIQWVSHPVKVKLRMYSQLFDQNGKVNPNSLHTLSAYCDKRVKKSRPYDRFQFLRIGYFCVDKSSKKEMPKLNLTVSLKGSMQ